MGDKSGIEWTDATWNPSTGCDKVSPGCDHCYAMTLAPRLKAMEIANGRAETGRYQTDGDPKTSGPGFGFAMHEDALDQPIRWTRPRVIFVNSMSDLFHGSMTIDFLARVFAVMSVTPHHTYQVLTKRPQVMRSVLTRVQPLGGGATGPFKFLVDYHRMQMGYPVLPDSALEDGTYAWPLPNVWLGTSVEDQKRADLRIGHLLRTPAAHRFLSCEPLLGPVDLGEAVQSPFQNVERDEVGRVEWVIAGGESGKGARPMAPGWVRVLRDQCHEAGVAFHFKQWGEWTPIMPPGDYTPAEHYVNVHSGDVVPDGDPRLESGSWQGVWRLGKRETGRTLDGRTHDAVPGRTDVPA